MVSQIYYFFKTIYKFITCRYERKVAATLFAEPPNASYEDALAHFLEAEKLADFKWKENKMMIAKCKISMKEFKEATEWLQRANDCIDLVS